MEYRIIYWTCALLTLSFSYFATALTQCKLTNVPLRATHRYFKLHINGDRCFNPDPVEGVTECTGGCPSAGKYTPGNTTVIRGCWCCTPVSSPNTLEVRLECLNGETHTRHMNVPSRCSCTSCELHKNIDTQVPIPT